MEELYSIMRDLLEVEYHQESFICLLKAAEAGYTEENQAEARLLADSAEFYLRALQSELKAAINKMDFYIAENAKRQ